MIQIWVGSHHHQPHIAMCYISSLSTPDRVSLTRSIARPPRHKREPTVLDPTDYLLRGVQLILGFTQCITLSLLHFHPIPCIAFALVRTFESRWNVTTRPTGQQTTR